MANFHYNPALNNSVFLEALQPYTIKLIAPASGVPPETIERLHELSQLNIETPPNLINQAIVYHASDDETRFSHLKEALYEERENTILWTLRGGYGSARLIDKLIGLPPPKYEKKFIGFSDNTALHLFLSQHWHWQTIHGSGLSQLLDPNVCPSNFIQIAKLLTNQSLPQSIKPMFALNNQAKTLTSIEGYLTGGNLTLVENSIGTPWEIQTHEKILFLEEVGEKGYRIDRSLNHLRQAGLFNHVKAVILGAFINTENDPGINIALERFAKEHPIPIYKTDQFGHDKLNSPLIYNSFATISYNKPVYELTMRYLAL